MEFYCSKRVLSYSHEFRMQILGGEPFILVNSQNPTLYSGSNLKPRFSLAPPEIEESSSTNLGEVMRSILLEEITVIIKGSEVLGYSRLELIYSHSLISETNENMKVISLEQVGSKAFLLCQVFQSTKPILFVLAIKTGQLQQVNINLGLTKSIFHPKLYRNKLLLVKEDTVELVNLRSKKHLFTFSFDGLIHSISETPVLDVVAISLSSKETNKNTVYFWNLKTNKELTSLQTSTPCSLVRCIEYQEQLLVLTVCRGESFVWDLFNFSKVRVEDEIIHAEWLVEKFPLLYLTTKRNEFKILVFDEKVDVLKFRPLVHRIGLNQAKKVRWFAGKLLVLSDDGVWRVNPIQETNSQKMKTKGFGVLSSISDLAFGQKRLNDSEYNDVILIEDNQVRLCSWKLLREQKLTRFDHVSPLSKICLSPDQEWVYIATRKELLRVNLQSGRESLIYSFEVDSQDSILSVSVNTKNKLLYILTESEMKCLNIASKRFVMCYELFQSSSTFGVLGLVNENGVCHVITNDFMLFTYSFRAKSPSKPVRSFQLPGEGIPRDLVADNQGKLLVIAIGKQVLCYEILTNKVVSKTKSTREILSVDIDKEHKLLAVAVEGEVGVQIWKNSSLGNRVTIKNANSEVHDYYSPGAAEAQQALTIPSTQNKDELEDVLDRIKEISLEKAYDSSLGLDGENFEKWKNFSVLNVIRERNKPREKPEKPDDIPFFLPMGKNLGFDDLEIEEAPLTEVVKDKKLVYDATAFRFLQSLDALVSWLRATSTSQIDATLGSICFGNEDEPGLSNLRTLLQLLEHGLVEMRNIEMLQAVLKRTLKLHMDIIQDDNEAKDICAKILERQIVTQKAVIDILSKAGCIAAFYIQIY
eukprot:snap_masked-scaffold_13-processed-gene-4.26-mRNA-1 protein AED:1.00 eAED:1.00 QI:0/0/0/0/1/1/4/0/868